MDIKNTRDDQYYSGLLGEENKLLRLFLDISNTFRTVLDPDNILRVASEYTMKFFNANRCYYCEVDSSLINIRQDSYTEGLSSVAGRYHICKYPTFTPIIETGEVVYIENIHKTKKLDENLRLDFIKEGTISCLIISVKRQENIVAVFIISHPKPYRWKDIEVQLALEISERIWNSIEILKSEREKKNLLTQLREREERLATVLENIDASIWVTDSLDRISLIGGKAKKDCSFQPDKEPLYNLYKYYNFFQIDGTPSTIEDLTINRLINCKSIVTEGIIQCKRTQERFYREFRTSSIRNKEGQIEEVVVISVDIEERLRMRQALKDSQKHAMELVKELRGIDELRLGFLSSLSHELRNPLATLTLGLNLLDYTGDNRGEERKIRETLKRQTKQQSRLVDDLLNISRMTQNKFDLKLENMELGLLLSKVIEDSSLQFKEKQINIDINIWEEEIFIEGDWVRLTQVIENILHNAYKFTPAEGRIDIKLEKDKKLNKAIISIKDNGHGIAANLLDNIFEPYVQAKDNKGKAHDGLGMGLSIVKSIIEKHRGQIRALSDGEEMGTEFIIELPTL